MADQYVPGMEFQSWRSLPKISDAFAKASGGQFNPLLYAAGYALDKMAGPSDFSSKIMGVKPPDKLTNQPALGQGISAPVAPYVPENGGLGLNQSNTPNPFSYQMQPNMAPTQNIQAPMPNVQTSPLDTWSKLSFNFKKEQ